MYNFTTAFPRPIPVKHGWRRNLTISANWIHDKLGPTPADRRRTLAGVAVGLGLALALYIIWQIIVFAVSILFPLVIVVVVGCIAYQVIRALRRRSKA